MGPGSFRVATEPAAISATQTESRLSRAAYGHRIRKLALAEVKARPNDVVPTRDIVAKVKNAGIEIRGQNELNAISALLSRSKMFENVGRMGWRLSSHYDEELENENGEAEASPEAEEVDASSDDTEGRSLL